MPERTERGLLEDKVAVVTGASSGIGEAMARRFAAEGARVVLAARNEERLNEIAAELRKKGSEAVAHRLDVTSPESARAVADAVRARWGEVDLLVNNAGTGGGDTVERMDPDTWREVLAANLDGMFYVTHAMLPLMRGGGGTRTILNVGSVAGTMGMPGGSAYSASKFGVKGFTESLALEVANDGIRVTVLQPGYVNTRWHADKPGDMKRNMVQPEDLADLAVYLATMPETAYVDTVTVWPRAMYAE